MLDLVDIKNAVSLTPFIVVVLFTIFLLFVSLSKTGSIFGMGWPELWLKKSKTGPESHIEKHRHSSIVLRKGFSYSFSSLKYKQLIHLKFLLQSIFASFCSICCTFMSTRVSDCPF